MDYLDTIYHLIWSIPFLALILGVGVYMTVVLKGLQFRYLIYALKLVVKGDKSSQAKGDISHFQSLMTALAATVGIGNIAGVATAITIGGVGAIFWMWVMALFGMATKYAEAILAVKYREKDRNGEMCGGPMFFIEKGLGWKKMAATFAIFGSIATLGGGNILQANSVADVMQSAFNIDPIWTGVVMAIITGITLLGGIKSIGKVAGVLVPFMALFYVGGGVLILLMHYDQVPFALFKIVTNAFTGQAAAGGFTGATVAMAVQVGISRGLMTSEAGLGTGSIAAAAAKCKYPAQQAMVSMTGSFLATVVMCSITGLVLIVTGVFGDGYNGASMTHAAFESSLPYGGFLVTFGLVLFAFTTLIGWAYYGEKCLEYLLGEKVIPFYRILFCIIIIPGAILKLEVVWRLSDIFNGLMAIPNLIGLCGLTSVVLTETRIFLTSPDFLREQALT